jgi:hypothetical protein
VTFICLHHRIFLQDTCPACQVPAHVASRKLSLLPSPTVAGLHPLQCRNTRTDLTHCGDRMDNPDHVIHTSTPSPEVIELQHRLQHLLSPDCDPTSAFAVFSDLQVLAAIVQATWPATASVTPEHRLANAFDAHITAQQHGNLTALTHVQRGNLWVTPPLSAPAMAGLMDIASRLLALPPAALPQAITALLGQLPPPTASGWGSIWTRLRHDASPEIRTQVMSALPRSFRAGGSREDASWRIARRPALCTRDRGYLPEHIPQWLPDDWFRLAVQDSSPKAMGRSVTYRRFVAVQLVQIATGFQLEEAARFLGIPDAWHQAPIQQRKLHSRSRYRHRTEDLSVSLESVGRHLAQLESPVNYRARRMRYSDWTLGPEEWASMTAASLPRQEGHHGPPALLIHACVSSSIWARLTGSEWRLAPSILIHFSSISSLDMGGKQAQAVRHRIRHGTSPYYRGLAELINQVAAAEHRA